MFRAVKIRLLPTPEQEQLFWKSAGAARWAWNEFLAANAEIYREYKKSGGLTPKGISGYTFQKYVARILKPNTHQWLREVGATVVNHAIIEADRARQQFFKGKFGYPHFKSKHKSKISFYVCNQTVKRTANGFTGERLGNVKTVYPLPKIEGYYSDPHITFDGKHWYLGVGYKTKPRKVKLTKKTIGIDLGIKELAVLSDGRVFHNINHTERVFRLIQRLKKEQRKFSRKIEANIGDYVTSTVIGSDDKEYLSRRPIWKRPLHECKNINRQSAKVRAVHKKLRDIRQNYIHQTTRAIVKAKPSRIVMENLNIRGMMKNRHLRRAIIEQKWFEFKRQIKYKAEELGIEVIEADRFYASSKMCSHCGHVKHDLKLSDRIYHCSECGFEIDRDLNAAINLAHYLTLSGK